MNAYYDTTNAYAERALAGWEGDPAVSDREFVSAAYQASQIIGTDTSSESWGTIFGRQQILQVDDPALRAVLVRVAVQSNESIRWQTVATDYRENVRRALPGGIQQAIREQCGDQPFPDDQVGTYLPPTCELDYPEDGIREAARILRARPDLREDLGWHLSEVATFRFNLGNRERAIDELHAAIEQQGL